MSEIIVIPEARLRYINHLYTPSRYQNDPGQRLKYSAAVLVPKVTPGGQALKVAFDRVVMEFFGVPELAYGQTPCLLEASLKFPGDPFYNDYWFLSMSRGADDGAPKVLLNPTTPVVDKGEIYPGVNVAVHGSLYAYKGGRGGVNFDLFGVMKTGDNERIGDAPPDSGEAFGSAGVQGSGGTIAQPTPSPQGFTVPAQPVAVQPPPSTPPW